MNAIRKCVFVCLILANAATLRAEPKKFLQHPKKKADHYVVSISRDAGPVDVPGSAESLARRFEGTLLKVWNDDNPGFYVRMNEKRARALSEDPRVRFVEEDGIIEIA